MGREVNTKVFDAAEYRLAALIIKPLAVSRTRADLFFIGVVVVCLLCMLSVKMAIKIANSTCP